MHGGPPGFWDQALASSVAVSNIGLVTDARRLPVPLYLVHQLIGDIKARMAAIVSSRGESLCPKLATCRANRPDAISYGMTASTPPALARQKLRLAFGLGQQRMANMMLTMFSSTNGGPVLDPAARWYGQLSEGGHG
jgi:hypothetical protein